MEHRTASQLERKPCPAPGRNPSIPLPTSRVAFAPRQFAQLRARPAHEAILWRQVGQILFALDALDRRKPQDRGRRFHAGRRQTLPPDGRDDY